MGIKIGINGFGRIGRVVMRILADDPERFDVCGINLRKADIDYMVYLLKYDSVFRNFPGVVEHAGGDLVINGRKIKVYSESDAAMINWADCGAEYIIESTGVFNTVEKASAHLQNGAKKVIISAPSKDDIMPTFVMGVNHLKYTPDMNVMSNASCTTNCLAPMTKVINDTFGIRQALMSTIHSATAKQKAVDSRAGRDWRTGRSVLGNIIPSSTGAAKAVGQVIPELKGKMTGMSFRVPTNDVSVVDLTARLIHPASYHDVCVAMRNAAKNSMKGIRISRYVETFGRGRIGAVPPAGYRQTHGDAVGYASAAHGAPRRGADVRIDFPVPDRHTLLLPVQQSVGRRSLRDLRRYVARCVDRLRRRAGQGPAVDREYPSV